MRTEVRAHARRGTRGVRRHVRLITSNVMGSGSGTPSRIILVDGKEVGDVDAPLLPNGEQGDVIYDIGVRPERHGYGTLVVGELARRARAAGAVHIVAQDVQPSSIGFWKKNGFRYNGNDAVLEF